MAKNKQSFNKFVKSSKHGKKWKKGQSCASNPSSNTFRQSAKKNVGFITNYGTSNSKLTVEALKKHEASHIDKEQISNSDESSMKRSRTISLASSYMSQCTNATFNKVISRFSASNLAAHKEVLAVLEGSAEVIKAQGEEDTDTKYFALLILLLKTNKVTESNQISAVLYLLSVCIKRIPPSLIKSKFGEISKIILEIIHTHINSDSQSLIKSALSILTSMLRYQDYASWEVENTKHIYRSILSLVDSHKPKIRKTAQHTIGAILRGSLFMIKDNAPNVHPAAHETALYCIKQLESWRKGNNDNCMLYILGLLGDILCIFNKNDLKNVCETILQLMTLSDSIIKSVAMTTFRKMFSMRPKESVLSAEINAQLISALYDYKPCDEDEQTNNQWLLVIQKAYSNLARLDSKLFLSNLPRLFESCLKMMSNHISLSKPAKETMIVLLRECNESVINLAREMTTLKDSVMHKLIRKLELGLGYQFISVWGTVLEIFVVFFEIFGQSCSPILKDSIKQLNSLRNTQGFQHSNLMDQVLGSAIRYFGPKIVLEILPLNITGEKDDLNFPRSWLIPLLRDNVEETELDYFIQHFLPLALKITNRCGALEKNQSKAELKAYQILRIQIWSLLPAFCTKTNDFVQSFPKIAQVLGKVITTDDEVRLYILSSLRKLITSNAKNEDAKKIFSRYSKNFIPIFCNLYTSTKTVTQHLTQMENMKDSSNEIERNSHIIETNIISHPHLLAILETFSCFLQVANEEVIDICLKTCYEKLINDEITKIQKPLILDLVIRLITYLKDDYLNLLLNFSLENLENSNKTLQKKCYRLLEEICSCSTEAANKIVTKVGLVDLSSRLIKSLSTSTPMSKAPRLRCLINILKLMDHPNEEFMNILVPEAILCTKATGSKARDASFNLLDEMATSYIRQYSNLPSHEAFQKFISMVIPGLASNNSHILSSTVLALSKLVYDFKASVSFNLLAILVEQLCLLLKAKSREIVKSALCFFKVLISAFDDILGQHLEILLSSLVSMKDDNRHHFRFKSKEIYSKLIKKFGFEVIFKLVPSTHHKILTHIKKELELAKKKRSIQKNDDDNHESTRDDKSRNNNNFESILKDSDSENDSVDMGDDEPETKSKKSKSAKGKFFLKNATKKSDACLKETDDIIDFLDQSANQKVLAMKPKLDKKSSEIKENGFKISQDGKIIIPTDEKDLKYASKKTEIDEAIDLMQVIDIKNRKRKFTNYIKDADKSVKDDRDDRTQFSYKSGGSGIHRPVKKLQSRKLTHSGEEFKAKKAKGDLKKGKFEPYAYVPLQVNLNNRRKKVIASRQLKNVMKKVSQKNKQKKK